MGAFAQLRLGADALNLAGARSGSVTIARELLRREAEKDTELSSIDIAATSNTQKLVIPVSISGDKTTSSTSITTRNS